MAELGYPTFEHRRIEVQLRDDEQATIRTIDLALNHLEQPGRKKRRWREETRTRLGTPKEQRVDLVQKAARELRMLLRVCNTAALWETRSGQVAKYLQDSPQGQLPFPGSDATDQPKQMVCRQIGNLEAGRLDDERVRQFSRIAERHRTVVFISERTIVLQYFASKLATLLRPSGFSTFLATDRFDAEFQEHHLGGENPDVQLFAGASASKRLQAEFDRRTVAKDAELARKLAFTTYKRAEGINLQAASAVVLIGVGADVKMLRQALGRIDRVDSPHPHITYYTLSLDGLGVRSDEVAKRRLREGLQFTHGTAHESSDPDERTDMVDALLKQNNLPRTPHFTNTYDCLWQLELEVPNNVRDTVSSSRLQGPWGIELSELQGDAAYTVFCLRGVEARESAGGFGPPRLVLVRDDGPTVLDQAEILRTLTCAYQSTKRRGLATVPTRWTEAPELLERVQHGLRRITPWCLRPARMVALLETLAKFVSGGAERADSLFSGLSLPALELLYQEWLDVLDPAWREAKEELRGIPSSVPVALPDLFADDPGSGGIADRRGEPASASVLTSFPGYLHCDRILEKLECWEDGDKDKARTRMETAIQAAEEISEGADVELWSRIAVVVRVSPADDPTR